MNKREFMHSGAAPAELDIVRGKTQLLLAFFLLVVLFTTMFGVGYQVGRNSSPGCAQAGTTATPAPEAEGAPTAGSTQAKGRATYLQVGAAEKTSAELLAKRLTGKGFQATVTPAPNSRLYRVLVGPVSDNSEMERLRASLKAMGLVYVVRSLGGGARKPD